MSRLASEAGEVFNLLNACAAVRREAEEDWGGQVEMKKNLITVVAAAILAALLIASS